MPEDLRHTLLLPQSFEHQRRTPAPSGVGLQPVAADPLHDLDGGGELRQRAHEGVEPVVCHELVLASQGGDDLLPDGRTVAPGLDDLQVVVLLPSGTTTFDTHEHAKDQTSEHARVTDSTTLRWHYILAELRPLATKLIAAQHQVF